MAIGAAHHNGAGTSSASDVTVLGEPLVRLGDHSSGDTEFGGQDPGGREAAADRDPAVRDGVPQLLGQPVGQAARRRVPEGELEEVGAGFGPVVADLYAARHWSNVRPERPGRQGRSR